MRDERALPRRGLSDRFHLRVKNASRMSAVRALLLVAGFLSAVAACGESDSSASTDAGRAGASGEAGADPDVVELCTPDGAASDAAPGDGGLIACPQACTCGCQETCNFDCSGGTGADAGGGCGLAECLGGNCAADCVGGRCVMDCDFGGTCNYACSGGTCEFDCDNGSTCTAT
jgi:hypothetical protein